VDVGELREAVLATVMGRRWAAAALAMLLVRGTVGSTTRWRPKPIVLPTASYIDLSNKKDRDGGIYLISLAFTVPFAYL
jgi:hypothetical protein